MNKRIIKSLFVCVLTLLVVSTSIPSYAEVLSYITEKDGIKYEYTKFELINSIIMESAQYKRYQEENFYAIKDSVQGYIDAQDILMAIIMSDSEFDVDAYTESDVAKKITITNLKRVDEHGKTVEDDIDDFRVIDIK